jgi:hypothetical protein
MAPSSRVSSARTDDCHERRAAVKAASVGKADERGSVESSCEISSESEEMVRDGCEESERSMDEAEV